jgi:hypothetical protein
MEGAYPSGGSRKTHQRASYALASQREIGFERRSTIGYLYVPEIALPNSNHIPDGTPGFPGGACFFRDKQGGPGLRVRQSRAPL